MSTSGGNQRGTLDISKASCVVWFDVRDWVAGSVSATRRHDGWTVAVLDVVASNEPYGGQQLNSLTLGPGDDRVEIADLTGAAWLGVRVSSTVEAASEIVDVVCCRKRNA